MNEYYNEEVPMYLRKAFSDEAENEESQVAPASDEDVSDATDEAIKDVVEDASNQVSEQKVQAMFSDLFSEALATRLYSEILESDESDMNIDVDGIAEETADQVLGHIANQAADEIYPEVRDAVASKISQKVQSYYNQSMYAESMVNDGEPLDSDENPYEDSHEYEVDGDSITDNIEDIAPEQVTQSMLEHAYLVGRQQALEEVGFSQEMYSDEDYYFDQNQQGAKEWFNKMKGKASGKVTGAKQFMSKNAEKLANSKVGAHVSKNKKAYGAGVAVGAVAAYGGKKLYDKYKKNKKQSNEEVEFDQHQQSLMDEAFELGRQQAFEELNYSQGQYSDMTPEYEQHQYAGLEYTPSLESQVSDIMDSGSTRLFSDNEQPSLEDEINNLM